MNWQVRISNRTDLHITTDASYHDMYYMGWGYGEDTLANGLRKTGRLPSSCARISSRAEVTFANAVARL